MATTWYDLNISLPSGASGEVRVKCPECSHKRKPEHQRIKDLAVNVEKGTFHCHHCGWSGGLATTDWRERKPIYTAPRPLPAVATPTMWDNVVKWFADRGIPESALAEKGITASSEYCPVCDTHMGTVLFPYFVGGKHVNTKHRCAKKHFRMEAGAQRVLYNQDACAESDTLVIVEGEIDALSVHVAGIPHVVSVPDGAPAPNAKNYASKFTFLEAAESLIERVDKVILAVDADDPGQTLMDELARRIGPEKCSRVIWPEGIKDANDCLITYGADVLKAYIDAAQPFPVEGIYTGFDLESDMIRLYQHGEDRGVGFGVPSLDEHYTVKTGQLTVVTGIPNHGKSTVMDQLFMWLAEQHDWTFAIFSPEQQPLARHQQHLIEQHVGKAFHTGYSERMSEAEMLQANRWVADRFAFILPETTAVDTILNLAKVQVFRNGVKGVVIDPWNELEHSRPRHLSETEYISEALSKFRRFARHHDVHVWLIAHPTKMRATETGKEPVPGLWDISGSAHFRNKADVGLTVWRDLELNDNTVELHITKMRFRSDGKLGNVTFAYDPPSKRLFWISR